MAPVVVGRRSSSGGDRSCWPPAQPSSHMTRVVSRPAADAARSRARSAHGATSLVPASSIGLDNPPHLGPGPVHEPRRIPRSSRSVVLGQPLRQPCATHCHGEEAFQPRLLHRVAREQLGHQILERALTRLPGSAEAVEHVPQPGDGRHPLTQGMVEPGLQPRRRDLRGDVGEGALHGGHRQAADVDDIDLRQIAALAEACSGEATVGTIREDQRGQGPRHRWEAVAPQRAELADHGVRAHAQVRGPCVLDVTGRRAWQGQDPRGGSTPTAVAKATLHESTGALVEACDLRPREPAALRGGQCLERELTFVHRPSMHHDDVVANGSKSPVPAPRPERAGGWRPGRATR